MTCAARISGCDQPGWLGPLAPGSITGGHFVWWRPLLVALGCGKHCRAGAVLWVPPTCIKATSCPLCQRSARENSLTPPPCSCRLTSRAPTCRPRPPLLPPHCSSFRSRGNGQHGRKPMFGADQQVPYGGKATILLRAPPATAKEMDATPAGNSAPQDGTPRNQLLRLALAAVDGVKGRNQRARDRGAASVGAQPPLGGG